MASSLRVVDEVEVPENPEASPEVQVSPRETDEQSRTSSPGFPVQASPQMVAMLQEIRRVLNARAGALIAMMGAFLLTAAAMIMGSWMALAMALSFDCFVFLPIALIAYFGGRS